MSLLSPLGGRGAIGLGSVGRPRPLCGGRGANVTGGGRATDVLGGGLPAAGFSGGRTAVLLAVGGRSERALGTGGRTGSVLVGLATGRDGAEGRTDELGLTSDTENAVGLDVTEAGGRTGRVAGLDAVPGIAAAFVEAGAVDGFDVSALGSFVKSTISRALALFLLFEVSAFVVPSMIVSSDRSMTRLVFPLPPSVV